MGRLLNLIGSIAKRITNFTTSLELIEKLDKGEGRNIIYNPKLIEFTGKNRLQVLGIGYDNLRQAEVEYEEFSTSKHEDDIDEIAIKSGNGGLYKRLNDACETRMLRRVNNVDKFAGHLKATIKDYENKIWDKDTILYHDNSKVTSPGISEEEVRLTIIDYTERLRKIDVKREYSDLIEKADDIVKIRQDV